MERHGLPARPRSSVRLHACLDRSHSDAGAGHDLFPWPDAEGGPHPRFRGEFGAVAGVFVHSLLAAFGLSALLAASAQAFTILKIAGALYLFWLAIQAVRHGSALRLGREAAPRQRLSRVFLTGAGINLLNPKIVMFFLTFLPQFISATDPEARGKLFFLGLFFGVIALPLCGILILAAARFTNALRRSPRIMRAVDWLFAGLMSAFAVRLLVARNS
jgi:threonine/homoserine/homoserine lactone efflux protein